MSGFKLLYDAMAKGERIMFSFFLFGIVVVLSVGIYWRFFDRSTPFTYGMGRSLNIVKQDTRVFKRGEWMLIERENCASRDVLVSITRELVSLDKKNRYVMESSEYPMEKGCTTTAKPIQIPMYVIPGEYGYRVTFSFPNNPLFIGRVNLTPINVTIEP